MTRAVWKFTVPVDDHPHILMDAILIRWLHVETAGPDTLTVWALVRPMPDGRARRYRLNVHGTGHPVAENVGRHIGSVVWNGPGGRIPGRDDAFTIAQVLLVWHVFAEPGTEIATEAA